MPTDTQVQLNSLKNETQKNIDNILALQELLEQKDLEIKKLHGDMKRNKVKINYVKTQINKYTPKVVHLTHDISTVGFQVIKGLGFQPTSVIFFSNVPGTPMMSFGMDDGVLTGGVFDYHNSIVNTYESASSVSSILLIDAAGGWSKAGITSLDSDGFTLEWVKFASPTGTARIYALCFR